jgi:hypothetical protein
LGPEELELVFVGLIDLPRQGEGLVDADHWVALLELPEKLAQVPYSALVILFGSSCRELRVFGCSPCFERLIPKT